MKVGITFSSFELLHVSDVKMLHEVKKSCDFLIVGLQLNTMNDRTVINVNSQSIIEKYIQLKDSKYVDEIIPYFSDQDIDDIMRSFKLDVRIIVKKYESIDFKGKKYCLKKGIEIIII